MPSTNKGTNASKVLASQQHHPLQSIRGAVGIVYELPKNGRGEGEGSLSTLRATHRHFTEEAPKR